jgi:hypothetical protein
MVPVSRNRRKTLDYPLLQTKVTIEKPKDVQTARFSDAIRALAKATGCNMVVEDFLSHAADRYQAVEDVFAKDTSIARLLEQPVGLGIVDYRWFFNESDKLLIGWADDGGDRRWRDHHRNMLSEDYLRNLKSKLDGPGVGFEDAVPLMMLPQRSFEEWIFYSRDFACLDQLLGSGEDVAWWKLYEALTPEDKSAARSTQGLPSAKLDPVWIAAAVRQQKLMASGYVVNGTMTDEETRKLDSERSSKERAVSDPKVIETMVIRVKSAPAVTRMVRFKTEDGREAITGGHVPSELKLYDYSMQIDYQIDGQPGQFSIRGPNMPLPVWSPEREAQIIKEASNKKTK